MIINPYAYGFQLAPDFLPVIFVRGQSNATGRGEASRLALTEYAPYPADIYMYWKQNNTSTDNGAWEAVVAGNNTREYDQTATVYGGYLIAAIKLRDYLNRAVYCIDAGDGGTSLEANVADPDWAAASSGENYTISRSYYLDLALSKLATANPGKQIVVFKTWWQGESDAPDATAVTNYGTNFAALDTADQTNSYLRNAIWIITKIFYRESINNEAGINTALQAFRDAHPDRVYIQDISSYPKKQDLTTGQKGGYTASAADDEHQSYIAQNAQGVDMANKIIAHYALTSAGLSENTTNTGYNTSSINANYIRLQMSRNKVTIGSDNIISAVTNDLGGVAFTVVNTTRFKVDKYRGAIFFDGFSPYATGRIESNSAIGTTYFAGSFSMSCWFKPASGVPSASMHFMHDIQSTASANNSRVSVFLATSGKINVIYSQGGTAVTANTNTAVFSTGKNPSWHHLAVTFDDTNNIIKIYFDGSLQTLEAGNAGDLSTVTMASYINGTNKLQIGARRTGASTYSDYYFGMMREFTIQPVVYSPTDIANLMLN